MLQWKENERSIEITSNIGFLKSNFMKVSEIILNSKGDKDAPVN